MQHLLLFGGSAWAFRFTVVAILLVGVQSSPAQTPPDDDHALNLIFGDEHLASDVLGICSRATDLPPADRYEFLTDWVLPGVGHATFRVVADFSPTYPPPLTGAEQGVTGFRVPAGGKIISPALDLIDAASSSGRLQELRRCVVATIGTSVRSRIDRLTLLVLVDLAGDDIPSAVRNFGTLLTLVVPRESAPAFDRDATLLCVDAAARHPALDSYLIDGLQQIMQSYQDVVDPSIWQRQFSAACARVKQHLDRRTDGLVQSDGSIQSTRWFPASLPSARHRGAGAPVAQWTVAAGWAESLSSHDDDFLYFAVPMGGNFEVEYDMANFGLHECDLLVAGNWIRPLPDLESYGVGGFRGFVPQIAIAPQLTRIRDYIHMRRVVQDNTLTTWINGRLIHREPLPTGHDPWMAIHSEARRDGLIHNLRLSGDPVIPDQLLLTGDPDLAGWIPYFERVAGIVWKHVAEPDGTGQIHAVRQANLPRGCHMESALFYHRPMLENGSIQYDFWYDAGVSEAHPVLDRLCFLLDPGGVRVHWLTDGPFDRTNVPPDNLSDESGNRQGPGLLPLHDGAWNQVRLSVRGDTVDLMLNGQLICQRELEPTNQRHFGLFHYADQTELRVRNVIWNGDWPRAIPEIDVQQLAGDETHNVDERLPHLTAVFAHDFGADGLPLDRFAILDGQLPTHLRTASDGLHATRQGDGNLYRHATVAPRLTVRGDFDITASFEQLVTTVAPKGSCNVILMALADSSDECRLFRRRTLYGGEDQQLLHCTRVWQFDGGSRRRFFASQPMEASAGTLRLARRGETVYYLFAENDSRQFRVIAQEAFPAGELPLEGVRLKMHTHGEGGSTSVVWTRMTVRAESLGGPAVGEDDQGLPELNQQRAKFPESFVHCFSQESPADALQTAAQDASRYLLRQHRRNNE